MATTHHSAPQHNAVPMVRKKGGGGPPCPAGLTWTQVGIVLGGHLYLHLGPRMGELLGI